MKIKIMNAVFVLALGACSTAAFADTVYQNTINLTTPEGDCSFSSNCGVPSYAAQAFSISTPGSIQSGSFTILDTGTILTSANWEILDNSGTGGLPGNIIYSGSASIAKDTGLGKTSAQSGGYNIDQLFFNMGNVSLGSGSYYFAIQGINAPNSSRTYLALGTATGGDAIYTTAWTKGYMGLSSIAVGLYSNTVSAVPLPASTWLFGSGLIGLIGIARRKARS